jgi:hypothetical protein
METSAIVALTLVTVMALVTGVYVMRPDSK